MKNFAIFAVTVTIGAAGVILTVINQKYMLLLVEMILSLTAIYEKLL